MNQRKPATRKRKPRAETDLFHQLIHLTGMPANTIRKELKSILERKNIDLDNLTLEQLRTVVASYMRQILGTLLDRPPQKKSEITH